MFIILLLMTGCAHTTSPSPLPESTQQQLGKIGVAASSTEKQEALGTPGTGRFSNIGRGTGHGAAAGTGGGVHGGRYGNIRHPCGSSVVSAQWPLIAAEAAMVLFFLAMATLLTTYRTSAFARLFLGPPPAPTLVATRRVEIPL